MPQGAPTRRHLSLERTAPVAPALGAACMVLLGNRTWVRRRSETATFESYEFMRLSTTLDVTVPDELVGRVAIGADHMILPLDVLKKGPLVNFDLTAQGKPASLLQSREVATVTAWMLTMLALDAGEQPPDDAALKLLVNVCDADVARAHEAYAELEVRLASTHPTMLEQAEPYCDRYILLVEMEAAEQLIVKYARDERLSLRATRDEQTGLDATPLSVALPSVAFGASYHVEAVVPGELRIVEARLEDDAGRELYPSETMRDRASMYPRDLEPGATAELTLLVRTQSDVFLMPAAAIAVLSTLALVAVGGLAVAEVIGDSVSGAAAGVAFLTPSIAAGLVLQRPAAPIVRVMLQMARLALVVVTVATIAAAAAMAFGLRDAELGVTWLVLAAFTATAAGILCTAASRAPRDSPGASLPPSEATQ